jgi:hypothetical protein
VPRGTPPEKIREIALAGQETYRMIRHPPRHTRWEKPRVGPVHQAIAYLIGTVGVAIALAVAITMAERFGWLDHIRTALRHVELPGLPSLPHADLPEQLPGFAENGRNIERSTTTLWQRGSEHSQPPSAAKR